MGVRQWIQRTRPIGKQWIPFLVIFALLVNPGATSTPAGATGNIVAALAICYILAALFNKVFRDRPAEDAVADS